MYFISITMICYLINVIIITNKHSFIIMIPETNRTQVHKVNNAMSLDPRLWNILPNKKFQMH